MERRGASYKEGGGERAARGGMGRRGANRGRGLRERMGQGRGLVKSGGKGTGTLGKRQGREVRLSANRKLATLNVTNAGAWFKMYQMPPKHKIQQIVKVASSAKPPSWLSVEVKAEITNNNIKQLGNGELHLNRCN